MLVSAPAVTAQTAAVTTISTRHAGSAISTFPQQRVGVCPGTITSDERLANARQLRHVSLDGTTLVVDASSGWNGTAQLVDQLSKIKGVGAITDSKGRTLQGSIPTTIVA